MYRRMQNGWRGGLIEGTPCGQSSRKHFARKIMAWLPTVCRDHGIRSVCDAGAGDLHWIRDVDWDVEYRAFDLIPRHPDVERLDITRDRLPDCDAVLCRMVLNHLDQERVGEAIALFRESARFLFATHFAGENINRNREFTRLDLTQWLGEPIAMSPDGHEPNCNLALWEIRSSR